MVAPFERPEDGLWLVVGGAEKGGIVVRTGAEFWSSELPRLQTGSVVRETLREGDRVRFEKVRGAGPEMGWVSISLKGKPLLRPAVAGAPPSGPSPAEVAAKLSRRDTALQAVLQDWRVLEDVPAKFRADRAFVMAAVESCGHALMYAAEELRADKSIVLAAVAQNGNAVKHAAKELRGDSTVVLATAAQSVGALRHIPSAALADRQTVLALVEQDPQALQYASRELRADREVMLSAVRRDARTLEHSPTLRGDREIMLIAVQQDVSVLDFAPAVLRKDKDLMLAAIATDGTAIRYASAELRADREVVTAAVSRSPRALEHAAPRLRADRELVRKAVEQDWAAVQFAAEELRGDFDIMALAVAQDRRALEFASPSLRVNQKLQDTPSRARGTNRGEVRLMEDADEREELAPLLQQAKSLRKRTFRHSTPEEDELPDGSHVTVVANSTGTVMLAYVLYTIDPKGGQCLFVYELAVHEDHRNKGLGRDLLQWAIRRAKAGEVFAVWLNSLKGRPERFYESLGFLKRPEPKPPSDGTVPMALMLRDPSLEAQLQPLKAASSEGQQR